MLGPIVGPIVFLVMADVAGQTSPRAPACGPCAAFPPLPAPRRRPSVRGSPRRAAARRGEDPRSSRPSSASGRSTAPPRSGTVHGDRRWTLAACPGFSVRQRPSPPRRSSGRTIHWLTDSTPGGASRFACAVAEADATAEVGRSVGALAQLGTAGTRWAAHLDPRFSVAGGGASRPNRMPYLIRTRARTKTAIDTSLSSHIRCSMFISSSEYFTTRFRFRFTMSVTCTLLQ